MQIPGETLAAYGRISSLKNCVDVTDTATTVFLSIFN